MMTLETLKRREVAIGFIFVATIVLFFVWQWWDGLTPIARVQIVSRILSIWGCCLSPVVAFSLGWMLRSRRDTIRREL